MSQHRARLRNQEQQDAFVLGYNASEEGRSCHSNPFTGVPLGRYWTQGYVEGSFDLRKMEVAHGD